MNDNKLSRLLLAMLLGLLFSVSAVAKNNAIVVRDFAMSIPDRPRHHYVVDLQFAYQLDDSLRDSLLNGLTLKNTLRFDLIWHNEWWFNTRDNLDTIVTELKYNALSRHYQLIRVETGESWNFSNLSTALDHLGRIREFRLPLLPDAAYHRNASIYIESVLEPNTPDLPLNFSSIFSSRNRLVSEGVLWPVTP